MVSLLGILLVVVVFTLVVVLAMRPVIRPQTGKQLGTPACARCGYSTKGISELKCPECGADLTEVGTVMPGERRALVAGCLMPLLATIVIFLLASAGSWLSEQLVPVYVNQSTHFDAIPDSEAYSQLLFRTDMTLVIPPKDRHLAHRVEIKSNPSPNPPYTMNIDYGGGPNATVKVHTIAIEVMAMRQSPHTITYASSFRVDPETRIATWSDAQGNAQSSNGPVTNKDLLTYFAEYQIDINRPDVIAESQQLASMIDGLIAGQNQFALQGFDYGGFGSGGSGSTGPQWFYAAYILAWFVIWILTITWLARRRAKSLQPAGN